MNGRKKEMQYAPTIFFLSSSRLLFVKYIDEYTITLPCLRTT